MSRLAAAPPDDYLASILHKARSGSAEALGQLFEACRGDLLAIAYHELHGQLRAKIDAADVVQETFIEATRDFAAFRGESGPQLLGWLRSILRHNLADIIRHFECSCRALSQEVRLFDPTIAAARQRVFHRVEETICEQIVAQEQRRALDDALQ